MFRFLFYLGVSSNAQISYSGTSHCPEVDTKLPEVQIKQIKKHCKENCLKRYTGYSQATNFSGFEVGSKFSQ